MRMKRRELSEALKVLNKVADHKSAMEILGHVNIESVNGKAKLTVTDLNNTLSAELSCEGDLSAVLPAKLLAKLVKPEGRKDAGEVLLEVEDGLAVLEVGGATTKIPTKPLDDFPARKSEEWGLTAVWLARELVEALSYIIPATSQDETRPHICCVFFDQEGMAVSTDGHRLHTAPLPSELAESITLRQDTGVVLQRILKKAETVIIAKSDKSVRIRAGLWTLDTTVVAVDFPPWRQVVPKQFGSSIAVEADRLVGALRRVAKVLPQKNSGMRLVVNGVLTVQAEDPELGSAEIVVPTLSNTHKGEDLVVGYNTAYLLEAISKATKAKLFFGKPLDPLRVELDNSRTAVVVPSTI